MPEQEGIHCLQQYSLLVYLVIVELSDKYLLKLSKEMDGDWKVIGGFLGVKHSQIQELIAEHKTDPLYAAWSMLVAWRDSTEWSGDSMRQQLKAALLDADRSDITHKLQMLVSFDKHLKLIT